MRDFQKERYVCTTEASYKRPQHDNDQSDYVHIAILRTYSNNAHLRCYSLLIFRGHGFISWVGRNIV